MKLPVVNIDLPLPCFPPNMQFIQLPDWAQDLGENGHILIPSEYLQAGEHAEWQRTDWWAVAFWYLNGLPERAFEETHGEIHSYSFRLKHWDDRMWQKPWVNHIALFLRRWAAVHLRQDETSLFGKRPEAEIILTHDVDAVTKTLKIRLKQAAFHKFNALKLLLQGKFNLSAKKMMQMFEVTFRKDNYWCFEQIRQWENQHGLRSIFNFYGGYNRQNATIKKQIIDPDYDVGADKISKEIRSLLKDGWEIGLHQSYDAWRSVENMQTERAYLEAAAGQPITSCRQHWLMFSWRKTWEAQEQAGLKLDTTLGFNNRPAFRSAAALRYAPWSFTENRPMTIEVIPLVLMDSHLYDYQQFNADERQQVMQKWIDAIKSVGGVATVVWHQRVMSRDYGWDESYKALLKMVT